MSLVIPEPLGRFIKERFHSVLQLELLLTMRARPVEWTPQTMAGELRITEQSAHMHLKDLQRRGFLDLGDEIASYRCSPLTPELAALTDQLAQLYADARYTVINMIFEDPSDSARTLAEAFRLRRKGDS